MDRKYRMLNDRYRRRYLRVGRKWRKLKFHAKVCPDCGSPNVELADMHYAFWKRFWLECMDCHWCGKSRPTIRMAIRTWNRHRKTACCGNCIYGAETDINGWMICNSDGRSVDDDMVCDLWRRR